MRSLDWKDGVVEMVDQTKLPQVTDILRIETVADLVAAIQRLSVRGAPALGVAGAYGVVMAANAYPPATDRSSFDAAVASLREARPTAVNLARMVDRVQPFALQSVDAALKEAHAIRDEELQASIEMGDRGADLVVDLLEAAGSERSGSVRAMTICNTGGLATVERGTCLLYTSPSPRDATLSRMPSSA